MRASVSWARAWTWWSLFGGGRYVLETAWIFTVRLSIFVRSGSYAASALRSVSGRAGTAGGSNSTSGVIRATWLSLISLSKSISSRCCELAISLLLIYIVLQVIKKVQHTKFFVSPNLFSIQ
jgi:hypothetical protein